MIALLFALFTLNPANSSTQAIPGCVEQTTHAIEGKSLPLCWLAKIEGWVSPNCIQKKSSDCGSMKIHGLAKKKTITLEASDARGGKNPGSAICTKLGGKVKYGILEGGSQQTFCEASDGSLVDSNALSNAFFSNQKEKGAK